MARPKVKIDLGELEKLGGLQCTIDEIAAFFGVSSRTIERRCKMPKFREIIDNARAKGRVSVRRSLFKLATEVTSRPPFFSPRICSDTRTLSTTNSPGPVVARFR